MKTKVLHFILVATAMACLSPDAEEKGGGGQKATADEPPLVIDTLPQKGLSLEVTTGPFPSYPHQRGRLILKVPGQEPTSIGPIGKGDPLPHAKFSPDGRHVAAAVWVRDSHESPPEEGHFSFQIIDLVKDQSTNYGISLEKSIHQFLWFDHRRRLYLLLNGGEDPQMNLYLFEMGSAELPRQVAGRREWVVERLELDKTPEKSKLWYRLTTGDKSLSFVSLDELLGKKN